MAEQVVIRRQGFRRSVRRRQEVVSMRRSWLSSFSMGYAVTQMCDVAAFEPTDGLQLDVAQSSRLEQPPSPTQQHRNEVQFEFVELAGRQQRLRGARAVDQHGPIARRLSGLRGTHVDVGVELRAARWLVARVDVVRQHVDRHAVVMIAVPAAGQLERAASGDYGAGVLPILIPSPSIRGELRGGSVTARR